MPIREAFSQLRAGGSGDECESFVLFLTDGTAPFEQTDYDYVRSVYESQRSIVLTYALGTGADLDVVAEIARLTDGRSYTVPDNADLQGIMARYFLCVVPPPSCWLMLRF